MRRKRTRFMQTEWLHDLEEAVNWWIEENENSVDVVDIQYNTTYTHPATKHSVMIVYYEEEINEGIK